MISRDSIPFRIASSFPGRLRLQYVRDHRRDELLDMASSGLSALRYVHNVEVRQDASCLIVRYAADRAEPLVLRDVEQIIAGLPVGISRNGRRAEDKESDLLPSLTSLPDEDISVLHAIPGRLRLRIPRLRRNAHAADFLHENGGEHDGIYSIEAQPDAESVIVRYDPKVQRPSGVVKIVGRMFRTVAQDGHTNGSIVRGRDILTEQPPGPHPLLLPSVAVGLAALGGAPALLTGGALALASLPIASRAAEGARRRRFNVDQLDLAALVVLAAMGDFLVGGLMTWLIGLGEAIRAKTMRRSRRAIAELMSPAEQQAWVEREGTVVSVPVDELHPGDRVLVYPGDQIPVDGVVIEGRALVDQKTLTGESAPVAKETGDPVYALTHVADGQIAVRVEHIGKETRAGRVVEMIEDAPLSDTQIQNYASKIGDGLVAPIFGLAGATYLLTRDPFRMAAILILDFATGIRLSAPMTVLSAMTGAAKQGLFIKGGKAMEKLACVDAVVFDKTGTLTRGEPVVTLVHSLDPTLDPNALLRLAASAEANLKHPAAKAVVDAAAARGIEIAPSSDVDYSLGFGIQAVVEGRDVNVGSEQYAEQLDVDISAVGEVAAQQSAAGHTLLYVLIDKRLAGVLAYTDSPRVESPLVIRALLDRRVQRIVMLTGDNERAARSVASELGITDVIANAFPEQKADVVERLRDEGCTVAVIGDGINDSAAFTRADVGISLQNGADVAKETADVILLDGDLRALPRAIDLSREAMGILKQNINIVVCPTAIGLGASLIGLTNPLISTLINNGTAVIAGLNALRPLFSHPREPNRAAAPMSNGHRAAAQPALTRSGSA